MTKTQLLSTAIVAASLFGASQAAMAYEAGDILVRGDVAKTSPEGDDDNAISNEKGFIGSVGYMVHDKFAVSLGGGEEFEHTYKAGEPGDSFERQPFDLMAQFYPLGGLDARVQPYAGIGANYTRFSNESAGLNLDNTWAPKGELGVDLIITDYLSLNGFASYTDLDVDYSANGDSGELDLDPVTVGGGVTFNF
ncbi:outer membrane protein [Modicisalibacter ilicicola DSM 19980]|uniref:Outer membrane protein n=1 Tax=Modicisalibacter ilicicola DSM 19980 TaxID=1121942 RepID=A0A1M4S900_9GAMM|nr:OmpW family outer membrane protein [Halomonas ilicicola]SHE28674.1 outer membrane protein [Halomonas ilicicola DSM 19980]